MTWLFLILFISGTALYPATFNGVCLLPGAMERRFPVINALVVRCISQEDDVPADGHEISRAFSEKLNCWEVTIS